MTTTINDYLEVHGNPNLEVVRFTSTTVGDSVTSKKFNRIKTVLIQNHGATFATGIRDPPKVIITQGSATTNAKVTVMHSGTTEVFSLLIVGEF